MASPPDKRSISAIRCCGLISLSEMTGSSGCCGFQSRICFPPRAPRRRDLFGRLMRGFAQYLEQASTAIHVSDNGHFGHAVLTDLRGVDIHVDHFGVRRKRRQPPGDAVVEARAQRDNEVAA